MTTSSLRYPQRVRNELRFRELTVLRAERISAAFQRIVLGGDALDGFTSLGFDDHTKVFFPEPGSRFTPPAVTAEGIIWGTAFVRPPGITRRYMMKRVVSWRWISSFMLAAWPAAGLWRRVRAIH